MRAFLRMSKSQSHLAEGFARILDNQGTIFVEELGTWLVPNEDGTHSIVAYEKMKKTLYRYLLHEFGGDSGFSEASLTGTLRLMSVAQNLTRQRLDEDAIVFSDGWLNCDTFEFSPFPPAWETNKTYAKGDRVRQDKYVYVASNDIQDSIKPPSSDSQSWTRNIEPEHVALVALPMTYAEAMAGTDADCPKWMKFLGEVFVDENRKSDPAMIEIVSLMCGYFLMPHLKAAKIFMLSGPTAQNGKSTFLSILKGFMPKGTVIEKKFKEFASNNGNNWGKIDLIGKKVVICNEESGKDVDSGLIKEMGDGLSDIQARRLYQQPIQFRPSFCIITAFNRPPEFDHVDSGLMRRLVYIPCLNVFDGTREVTEIVREVLAEKNAILAWAIRQAKKLHERKWRFPEETTQMKIAKDTMLTHQNSVLEFVTERFRPSETSKISVHELYNEYVDWCHIVGRTKPYAKRNFGMIANDNYLGKTVDSNGIRYRCCERIPKPLDKDDTMC